MFSPKKIKPRLMFADGVLKILKIFRQAK